MPIFRHSSDDRYDHAVRLQPYFTTFRVYVFAANCSASAVVEVVRTSWVFKEVSADELHARSAIDTRRRFLLFLHRYDFWYLSYFSWCAAALGFSGNLIQFFLNAGVRAWAFYAKAAYDTFIEHLNADCLFRIVFPTSWAYRTLFHGITLSL